MKSWTIAALLVLVATAACSTPPAQPQPQTPPVATPPPVAEPAPKSESVSRADALIEDFKRRQAAQEKFDRENPPPKVIPVPPSRPGVQPAASAPPAAATNPTGAAPGSQAGIPPGSGRDERWWKDQMQALQLALNEQEIQLAAAERLNLKNGYGDAQAQYKKIVAAVENARQAIEKLRDEARRAGVPPAWLR